MNATACEEPFFIFKGFGLGADSEDAGAPFEVIEIEVCFFESTVTMLPTGKIFKDIETAQRIVIESYGSPLAEIMQKYITELAKRSRN